MRLRSSIAAQRGVALITSLLLLIIITILALSMFRGFSTVEKIAGNLREKDRALHAAESAEQYAEWWLLQNGNINNPEVTCAAGAPIDANLNTSQGQVCNSTTTLAVLGINPAVNIPWGVQYIQFLPPGMSVTPGVNGANGDPPYFAIPQYYIADLGTAADGVSKTYQIDALAYGAASSTVAVVESIYEIKPGVSNPMNP
jgi:type IV pilus assembly protein PilX